MGYKTTCNLSVGRGLDFKAGEIYSGPSDMIDGLLAQGLLAKDDSVEYKEQEAVDASNDLDLVEEKAKPVKKSKKGK